MPFPAAKWINPLCCLSLLDRWCCDEIATSFARACSSSIANLRAIYWFWFQHQLPNFQDQRSNLVANRCGSAVCYLCCLWPYLRGDLHHLFFTPTCRPLVKTCLFFRLIPTKWPREVRFLTPTSMGAISSYCYRMPGIINPLQRLLTGALRSISHINTDIISVGVSVWEHFFHFPQPLTGTYPTAEGRKKKRIWAGCVNNHFFSSSSSKEGKFSSLSPIRANFLWAFSFLPCSLACFVYRQTSSIPSRCIFCSFSSLSSPTWVESL